MLAIDVRTIVLLLTVICTLQMIVLALFSTLVASRYRGLGLLAGASALNVLGFTLLMALGALPARPAEAVASSALAGATALTLVGLNRFLERPRPGQELGAGAIVVLVAAIAWALGGPAGDERARMAVFSLAMGALYSACAWSLARQTPPDLRVSYSFSALVFGLNSLWMLARAVLSSSVVGSGAGPDLLSLHLLSFRIATASVILWLAGVVAMTTQRLLRDLRQAQAARLTALETAAREAEQRADETHELLAELTAAHRIIREREQSFRLTFDRSPLGAALIAPDGRFLRVNEVLCAAVGYSEGDLLRRAVFTLVHREDRRTARAQGRALLGGAERICLELRALRSDQATVWLRLTVGPVSDDSGQPLHFLALAEDITTRRSYEQHLRTVEHQMQLVLRTIPEQFWLKDAAGRYLLASHSLARFHGRRPEEFSGRTAGELYGPELSAFIRDGDAQVLEARLGSTAEIQLADQSGALRWLTTTRAPVYDDDGTLLGLVGVARDITAAKEAEAALRRSRERLELALWGAELGLWDWHIPSGSMETNAQLADLVGLRPAELQPVLEVWMALTHPDDLPSVQAAFTAVIEGQAEGIDVEFRIRHADGGWRWNAARGRAVERDSAGRAVRLVGVTRDITARQEAQAQLGEREQLLRSISDSLPDGLIYQIERAPDGSGRFRYLSAGVERLWGVSTATAYADAETLFAHFHPEDRPAFDRAARESLAQMSIFEFEGRVCLPDGSVRWSYSRSTPHRLPDGHVLRSGVELDVTARKQAEIDLQRRIEALQTLNEIGQVLTSWTKLNQGLATAAGLLRRLFRARSVAVWDYDAARGALRPLLLQGRHAAQRQRALTLAEAELEPKVLTRHMATIVRLAPGHVLLGTGEHGADTTPRRTLLLGLRTRNTVVGLLCIGASDPEQIFTPEDVGLTQTVGSLLASALENARLFVHARSQAAEQERRRLARELHDSVSQALFAANRTAELLPRLWELDPDEGRAALADLHRFTGGALAEMRALLIELRPRALIETPLHETLGLLLPATASRGGAMVTQKLRPTPPLPPEVQVALYRIVQEALNNASKHARADHVSVTLDVAPPYGGGGAWEGAVQIVVADNGRGFDSSSGPAGHFGLITMRERASDIGAQLEITSAPGDGTRIRVTWQGAARAHEEAVPA